MHIRLPLWPRYLDIVVSFVLGIAFMLLFACLVAPLGEEAMVWSVMLPGTILATMVSFHSLQGILLYFGGASAFYVGLAFLVVRWLRIRADKTKPT